MHEDDYVLGQKWRSNGARQTKRKWGWDREIFGTRKPSNLHEKDVTGQKIKIKWTQDIHGNEDKSRLR